MITLCRALQEKNHDLFFTSLSQITDPGMLNQHVFEWTALGLACKHLLVMEVGHLLKAGANPNIATKYFNKFPIHLACDHERGNLEMVQNLVNHGSEINVQDADLSTPLHLACFQSNDEVAFYLLEKGARIDLSDLDDETPLVRACYAHNKTIISRLIKAGSNVNYPNGECLEILIRAGSHMMDSVHELLRANADLSLQPYMSVASAYNNVEMMKLLREQNFPIDQAGRALGLTPLHHACVSIPSGIAPVKLLLHWGANVNTQTQTGDTPLHYAVERMNLKKVQVLLSFHPDVNIMNSVGLSPLGILLHARCAAEDIDSYLTIARLLIEVGSCLSLSEVTEIKKTMPVILSQQLIEAQISNLLDEIQTELVNARTLRELCRIVIRKTVKPNVDDNITFLPIPQILLDYLRFNDILSSEDSSES
ncbi:hypothetical protein ACJMK2_011133 [Sinanodonta woodiana]|uniref:SOCS box domain-containing protein n=1 Tax=Sinanodonta woodiana TaxID=1069815 RepID=A0ABD3V4J1_SINWO